MAIGTISPSANASALSSTARERAKILGALTLQARQLAMSVASGGHGRRMAGNGDSFWQFRPYIQGLPVRRIDWRRSARGNTIYIRDHEWEIAQTAFLCPDLSASMLYQSRFAHHSKEARALIISMALAELLTQAGERVAIPGLLEPTSRQGGALHVANALQGTKEIFRGRNDFSRIRRAAHVVILSDFLEDYDLLEQRLRHLNERSNQIYLIEIADRAEESFPYQGHVVFEDPENEQEFDASRAQNFAVDYKKLYLARRARLRDLSRRYGWHFLTSLTDQPISVVLNPLYLAMNIATRSRYGGRK